ncbi:hypothetical protein CsSME_00011909 [Camellia sinensis var. sinensis]
MMQAITRQHQSKTLLMRNQQRQQPGQYSNHQMQQVQHKQIKIETGILIRIQTDQKEACKAQNSSRNTATAALDTQLQQIRSPQQQKNRSRIHPTDFHSTDPADFHPSVPQTTLRLYQTIPPKNQSRNHLSKLKIDQNPGTPQLQSLI